MSLTLLRPVLAVLLVVGLGACAADPAPDPGTGPADRPASTSGVFPATVEHMYGQTTVESADRVVAVGVTDADVVLALGTTPVALTGYVFYESGIGPWAEELVEGEAPEVLDREIDVERVAALQPDLILAVSADVDEAVYEQLSVIAPTVVRPEGTQAYQVPRREATELIGAAMGQPEEAATLAGAAEEAYAQARAQNPQFEGATAAVALPYDGQYGVYTARDARGQAMAELGFVLPPGLDALDTGESFFVEVSGEQVSLLEADVLVLLADQPDALAAVEEDDVLQALPVVAQGRSVVVDTDTRGAITYNSVLSVPYALDRLVPQLDTALAAG